MLMCSNMCMWNDSGMVGKHVVVAFLSKWHSADLPLKIHNNSFLHFLAVAGIAKIIYLKFITEKTFFCIDKG